MRTLFGSMLMISMLIFLGCDEPDADEPQEEPAQEESEAAEDEVSEQDEEPDEDRETVEVPPLPDDDDQAGERLAEKLEGKFDVDAACDEPEEMFETSLVAISEPRFVRGAADVDGPRLIGCLHNQSDMALDDISLTFSNVQEDGGGFGERPLTFHPVGPGDSTMFVTSAFDSDADYFEERGLEGYEFHTLTAGSQDREKLDSAIEITTPVVERPRHDLESECEDVDPDDGEGDVWISTARMERMPPPHVQRSRVVGCVTNRSDAAIAEDDSSTPDFEITVSFGDDLAEDGDRMEEGSHDELIVEAPVEPGETALFASDFFVEGAGAEVELQPVERANPRRRPAQYDPLGPIVTAE